MYPQVHPLIALSNGLSTRRKMHNFLYNIEHFKCSLKWNLWCAQVQHRVPPQVYLFIESFCALLCPGNCTTMHIFKCNSIVTSSAPLISTSNAPSCASVYRSQGTTLGVPSEEPLVVSSIALTNAPSSAPSSATSNASFLSLSYASSMAL